MKFPKHEYVRSNELLRNARQIACQHCGADDGTVVAAHTNWQGGKGRGIKAHDYRISALCYACHMELDQGSKLSKQDRVDAWEEAHRKTIGWLFDNDLLSVR